MIENGTCQVHNVKFYNLAPRAIFYLSYNYNSSKMALVRLVFTKKLLTVQINN